MTIMTALPVVVSDDLIYQSPRLGDAGLDLLAAENVTLTPWTWTPVRTGLRAAIPAGYVGLVRSRSGLAFRYNVMSFGGVIDPSYRGEIVVLMCYQSNHGQYEIRGGQRIAQLVIVPYLHAIPHVVEELPATERGEQGFGSTGM